MAIGNNDFINSHHHYITQNNSSFIITWWNERMSHWWWSAGRQFDGWWGSITDGTITALSIGHHHVDDIVMIRLALGIKDEVPLFGPALPADGFVKKSDMRDFLLAKGAVITADGVMAWSNWLFSTAINGEKTALKAPTFASKLTRTREALLEYLKKQYVKWLILVWF